jgi:predicted esterase
MLSVRGNVMEHGAPRFFRRLAEGVFDLPDLHLRTSQLGDFVASAAARYDFPLASLHAVGFSNGANVAASLLLSRPELLAGGILLRAMVPFEPDTTPDLSGRAVLLSEGRSDPIIPRDQGEKLAELLRRAGAEVELAWQHSGHNLTNGDVEAGQRWLTRVSRGVARPT